MKRILGAAIALLMGTASAEAALIDFDDQLTGAVITNQYSGVLFSSTSGGGQIWTTSEASSSPNFLVGNPNSFHPITLDFTAPIELIAMDLISVGWATVTVTALAADLTTIIDSLSLTHFPNGPGNGLNNIDPISLSGSGISRVRVAITNPFEGDGIGIDNVSFRASTAVPEPGTFGLLALPLAVVLAGRSRVRRKDAA